jgi:nitrite reductase/ring-hydroxylating ferredoxin subunit
VSSEPHAREPSPVSPGLDRVAILERVVGASLERVWENVLDWEHLPWLHRTSFAWIELQEEGDWGWRARAASTGRPDDPFVVEVRIDRAARRYVSRTVAGSGAGTEIWTFLDPAGDDATRIRVEFWVPGVPAAARDRIGAGYLRLYERLWDEDESMMRLRTERLEERARPAAQSGEDVSAGAAPATRADLGPREALLARLPTCVALGGALWRIVVVDGELVVHDARCPHLFGPLVEGPEAPLEGRDPLPAGEVRCPWHGYRFDVRTGRSSDGRRLRLRRPPRLVEGGGDGRVALVLD